MYFRLHETLGSGQFGKVFKATWDIHPHKLELAVKTLKTGASDKDRVMMLQEAAIMGQFNHTNVIKMYGVVTLDELVCYNEYFDRYYVFLCCLLMFIICLYSIMLFLAN